MDIEETNTSMSRWWFPQATTGIKSIVRVPPKDLWIENTDPKWNDKQLGVSYADPEKIGAANVM